MVSAGGRIAPRQLVPALGHPASQQSSLQATEGGTRQMGVGQKGSILGTYF